ncbi:MAG: hypothetical protein AAGG69_09070 [Pseudomonadota bacterium]
MRRISTAVIAALAVAVTPFVAPSSVTAAPLLAERPVTSTTPSNVVKVGHRNFSFGITIRAGRPFYRGHRGFRKFRHGYVFYNGYYFPRHVVRPRVVHRPRVQKPKVIRLSSAHIRWCYGRYKTYRHHDNTYACRVGKRTYCRSPYSH